MTIQSLIDEYTPEYCKLIELAYGENWMSDGGDWAIDQIALNVDFKNKRILDIGSGLGGACFHLAKTFNATVTGLEINPWLVKESTHRTPQQIKSRVDFKLYNDVKVLPFDDGMFDIVFSHGVLVHVADKLSLFNEIYRVLNNSGSIAFYDWVTPESGMWGPHLLEMCEKEGLTLEITTKKQYIDILTQAKFKHIQFKNMNHKYAELNFLIAENLENEPLKTKFIKLFSDQDRIDLLEGHKKIAKSMQANELLALRCLAPKG